VRRDWAAKVTLSLTPSKDQDRLFWKFTYTYNGETRTYTVPKKTKYKNGVVYSFVVEICL
jgi:hypothetical protein